LNLDRLRGRSPTRERLRAGREIPKFWRAVCHFGNQWRNLAGDEIDQYKVEGLAIDFGTAEKARRNMNRSCSIFEFEFCFSN
jgi:hypothetical protein